jgi:thioredoxin-related protein
MRIFFILLVFLQFAFSSSIPTINKISDLPKEKDIILIFSMDHCPYCIRQEKNIIEKIQPQFPQMGYYKTKRGTKVFEELIQTGNFGEVEYFPTTFILIVDEDGSIFVKYPFKGFQRSSSIIRILNNKEIMEY